MDDARTFAGPLPFMFGYEACSGRMVVVKGLRRAWDPEPVRVVVHEATYLERDLVPRQRQIVARVVGEKLSRPVVRLVALGEVSIGLWMLSGIYLPACVALQTVVIIAMNTLELRVARDSLLAPRLMLCANAVLLAAGWYVALAGR